MSFWSVGDCRALAFSGASVGDRVTVFGAPEPLAVAALALDGTNFFLEPVL